MAGATHRTIMVDDETVPETCDSQHELPSRPDASRILECGRFRCRRLDHVFESVPGIGGHPACHLMVFEPL